MVTSVPFRNYCCYCCSYNQTRNMALPCCPDSQVLLLLLFTGCIRFQKTTKQSTGKTQNSEVWVLTATDSKELSNVVEAWGWITCKLSAILPTICVKSKLLMATICVNIETAGNSSRPRRSPRQTLRFHLGNQNLGNHGWINHSNLHMFKKSKYSTSNSPKLVTHSTHRRASFLFKKKHFLRKRESQVKSIRWQCIFRVCLVCIGVYLTSV